MTFYDRLSNIPALAIDNLEAFAIGVAIFFPIGVLAGYLWRKF